MALDPQFAEAWSRLASLRLILWSRSNRKDYKLASGADFALSQAERFGSGLPQIPLAKNWFATIRHRDREASIELLLEALAIDPSFHYAKRQLGVRYLSLGQLAQAQHYLEAVLQTDPLSPRSNSELFGIYLLRKSWVKADTLLQTNLDRSGGDDFWKEKSVLLDYLQTGGKQVFIHGIESRPSYQDSAYQKTIAA